MHRKMNEDYSNREIDNFMKGIHDKLDLILTQTTQHNGRLKKVELWKARIVGMMSGFMIIVTIVGGLLVYVWDLKIGSIEESIDKIETKFITINK